MWILIVLLIAILKSPFSYPYFTHTFDVSRKRQPHIDDYLDQFLISNGFAIIQAHQKRIDRWKSESQLMIEHSILKQHRLRQYERALDDNAAFTFYFIRSQTRYKQVNYVKTPYKVEVQAGCFSYDFDYIYDRYCQLEDIGFECTLRTYHCKNQRKLATRQLREKIMERDNYTCQLCGKYMPDEVGLQVDHVIPVSKGGKTLESNLRVLCSKCNGSKHNKI